MHGVMSAVHVQAAQKSDARAIASIYNEGIAEREATFETEPRHAADFHGRTGVERYPLLVAELDGELVGWAGLAPYSERAVSSRFNLPEARTGPSRSRSVRRDGGRVPCLDVGASIRAGRSR